MSLGCNTNININNKRSGFATSIPISIVVQLILQYQYWYVNHILQICNINFKYNIKSLILAIPMIPQYHLILQYLGIDINTWFNNSTVNIGFATLTVLPPSGGLRSLKPELVTKAIVWI